MRVKRAPKRIISAAIAACAIVVAMFAGSTPAYADGNYGNYVDGIGWVGDDWSDNPEICYGCSRSNTDQVILWQLILYTDGFLSHNQLDGQFGPNTKAATKSWQGYKGGLNVDGRAGPKTWSKADDYLTSDLLGPNGSLRVFYNGRHGGWVSMQRGTPPAAGNPSDGTYKVDWASRYCSPHHIKSRVEANALRSVSTTAKTFAMQLHTITNNC